VVTAATIEETRKSCWLIKLRLLQIASEKTSEKPSSDEAKFEGPLDVTSVSIGHRTSVSRV